jgi:alpha-glucosidase (family GH31 glycosyl hydrolase)
VQSIDDDVERMNFKLVSVESSIRRMQTERQPGDSKNSGSWYAKHTKSRKDVAQVASELLLSRKKQQDKLIRLRLKKDWEHERMLISSVAVPDMKLSHRTTALVTASQKKMFEKKIQLIKLNSELKTMNLESVTSRNSCLDLMSFSELHFRSLRRSQKQMSSQNLSSTKKMPPKKLLARPLKTHLQIEHRPDRQ